MAYILFGVIFLMCLGVIIFGLKIYRENEAMRQDLKQREKDHHKALF